MREVEKRGCAVFLIIWGVAALVIGVVLNSINETGQSIGSIIFIAVFLGAWIMFIVFCFRMFVITSKARKLARKQVKADKADGVSRYDSIIHVGGLSAPENCKCTAVLNPEGLNVLCGGNEFFLRLEKIRNVDFQLDIDEKQYLKNSMIGGMAGAAMFGISGAIIGSSPKTKTKREVKCYAIISYDDGRGQYHTFILRDEIANLNRCAKLVDTLKPMIQQKVNKVEL